MRIKDYTHWKIRNHAFIEIKRKLVTLSEEQSIPSHGHSHKICINFKEIKSTFLKRNLGVMLLQSNNLREHQQQQQQQVKWRSWATQHVSESKAHSAKVPQKVLNWVNKNTSEDRDSVKYFAWNVFISKPSNKPQNLRKMKESAQTKRLNRHYNVVWLCL